MNGLMPDSGFKTTDNLNRGYGDLKHDADFTAQYDIKKEIPVAYYQHDIASVGGIEKRYEVSAGSHFVGFPFLRPFPVAQYRQRAQNRYYCINEN